MSLFGPQSERAVILAPNGRDGQIAAAILQEAGFLADIAKDLPGLTRELERGAGLAIITEESVLTADLRPLVGWLARQPAWSDLPIVLLTRHGGGPERNPLAARLAEALGHVTFLERPFHPTTLASVVRTAVRGRRRQYEARTRMAELGESAERLKAALAAGRMGSWTLDPELNLTLSESSLAHFGCGPETRLTWDALRAAIYPDDRRRLDAAIKDSLASGETFTLELRVIWPDGSTHWVDLRARAVCSPHEDVEFLVGVSSDITRRKAADLERDVLLGALRAERTALSDLTRTLEQRVEARTAELLQEVAARERAQEQLRQSQKMESIGLLTGGVAHDFNNLLMAVIGNLDLLTRRAPQEPRIQRLIAGAMQGAQRGAALTQRLLAFARQQDLKTSAIDMAELVAGMGDLLDRSLGPRIALQFDLAEGLPAARADANQVELAILNLAINARDAMPDGGAIAIGVDRARPPAALDLKPADYVRVWVADTGAGMDEETLRRAVEPFFSTKALGKGTGLGLSMVHGLATQLGGRLQLESQPGTGTVATLWLPIAAEGPVRTEPLAAPHGPSRSATILVVDDDPLIALSTVEMLADLGHEVIEVNSGAQALDVLSSAQPIDLMMTDHAMPEMSGMELARRAQGVRPGLPILLATGYVDLEEGEQLDLPRLTKPYDQAQLRSEIDRLLETAQAAQ